MTHFHETSRNSQFIKASIRPLKWENPLLVTFDIFALTLWTRETKISGWASVTNPRETEISVSETVARFRELNKSV